MSNLLRTYANYCGVQVTHKPDLPENYFPVPEKYITIHAGSGLPSKNYDYYSEVVALIKWYLDQNGIKVVQVGASDEKPIEHALRYNGKTDIRQSAYIVKKSLLHLGNDSVWVHCAAASGVPTVALYGATSGLVCSPEWYSKLRVIESHRNGNKPTNVGEENPKTINFIKPEEVACAVLDMLEINHSINIETIHIGADYHREILEIIPDLKNPSSLLKDQILNIRMDYYFDEDVLYHHLTSNKCSISTDKPININLLMSRRQNVGMVVYFLKEDYNKDFIKSLHYNGIPYKLFTDLKDDLSKIRINLFDFNPVEEKPKFSLEDIEKKEKITYSSLFKSNKFILSQGKVYTSLYHYQKGINIVDSHNNVLLIGDAINDEQFWGQMNHYYIFNHA